MGEGFEKCITAGLCDVCFTVASLRDTVNTVVFLKATSPNDI